MNKTKEDVISHYSQRRDAILKNSGINSEQTEKLLKDLEKDKARDLRRLDNN